MRTNLPVTDEVYQVPEDETLVTTTDLQGRILYCNQAFAAASGFTKEELLGQPHNLIRHPDMPQEAFRDMWETIAAGSPWSGLVKNRRKSGACYWVQANVTPLLDVQGRPSGYMSVRTRPHDDDVHAAESLYAQMRAEAEAGAIRTHLHRGRIAPSGPARYVDWLRHPSLFVKLVLACGLTGLLGLAAGNWAAGALDHQAWDRLLFALSLSLLFAYLGGTYLRAQVAEPIKRLTHFANQIAGGNLTQAVTVKQGGEVGTLAESLAQLNANIMSIVRDARHGMHDVREGSSSIAQGNLDLSQRTESAASNLQQTAASMEEITATIKQSGGRASDAARAADSARGIASESRQAVDGLANTMQRINDASRRIRDIIQVVDGIAFQTNILALNAAVEAARAGEHGRGFAVVAAEVRTLAQRTSSAAREVRSLIQSSVEQVQEGNKQTESVKDAMGSVQHAIDEVHAYVAEISKGMNEQMLGVEQINQAISQLDLLTQKNAALVEEIAASATDLHHKADDVAGAVAIFQLKGEVANPAQPSAVELRKQMKRVRTMASARQEASAWTAH